MIGVQPAQLEGKVRFDGETREVLSNEETRLIGVGIPKATLLYEMLRKDGANLNDFIPLSSDELAKILQEVIRR